MSHTHQRTGWGRENRSSGHQEDLKAHEKGAKIDRSMISTARAEIFAYIQSKVGDSATADDLTLGELLFQRFYSLP